MSNLLSEIKNTISDVDSKIAELNSMKRRIEQQLEFTQDFLQRMESVGYTKVSVGKKHKSVPVSADWPFGAGGSVFGFSPKRNSDKRKKSGHTRPPIWGVVEELGISNGTGNSDQHQADTSGLIDGVYHLKKGNWIRIEALQ